MTSELIKAIEKKENEKSFLLKLNSNIASVKSRQELLVMLGTNLDEIGFYSNPDINILNEGRTAFTPFIPNSDSLANRIWHRHPDGEYTWPDGVVELLLNADIPLFFNLTELIALGNVADQITELYNTGVQQIAILSLRDNGKYIGSVLFFAEHAKAFSDDQLLAFGEIARLTGIAVANILFREHILEREKETSFLLSVSKDITSCRSKSEFLSVINHKLKDLINAKEIIISLINDDGETHSVFITETQHLHPDYAEMPEQNYPVQDGIYEKVLSSTDPLVLNLEELLKRENIRQYTDFFYKNGITQAIAIPLIENNRAIGGIFMYMEKKLPEAHYPLGLLQGISSQIAIAVSNIRAYEKIQQQLKEIDYYKALLEEENQYLQQQIKTVFDDGSDMIGHAGGLKEVSELISRVAPSDTTVLILGETGTGKELVARALHNASPRKDKLMIKVNCAALPASLIESELFGHEKGSFTGATERRIGKFELANNGTLFLDEIGELALELQVKLLRALQEKEIERIGGKEVIKTNVRIIAATNRNLYQEVEGGRFRSDLYYRLNVFPIIIPSLKERSEDIPALVSHFMGKLSGRVGKNIVKITPDAMRALEEHTWPGNVRELEHVIERSALMTKDNTIREVYIPNNGRATVRATPLVAKIKSLDESERDHIKAILKRCNGKIKGAGGAAELLGLPPTTLHSKMKKLGIAKDEY